MKLINTVINKCYGSGSVLLWRSCDVMYFRFFGWRHVCKCGQEQTTRERCILKVTHQVAARISCPGVHSNWLTRGSVGSGRSLLSTIALLAFCVQLSRSMRPICRWPEARQHMAINRRKNHSDADTQKPRAGHNRDRYGPLTEPISKVDITDMPTASI